MVPYVFVLIILYKPTIWISKARWSVPTMMTLARLVSLLWACTIAVSRSYVIQPGTWRFRGHPIAYETAKTVQQKEEERDPTPVLLLNGFGVGSFHQHRLIHEMLGEGDHADRRIYCIDYLGQGE